jgi:hypothetical protein
MTTLSRPQLVLGSTAWLVIVAVLLVLLAAMAMYFL